MIMTTDATTLRAEFWFQMTVVIATSSSGAASHHHQRHPWTWLDVSIRMLKIWFSKNDSVYGRSSMEIGCALAFCGGYFLPRMFHYSCCLRCLSECTMLRARQAFDVGLQAGMR